MPDRPSAMTSLEIRSKATSDRLELSFERVPITEPGPGEVVVRIEAAPVNPTDISMLLGPANPAEAQVEGDGGDRRLTIPVSPNQASALRRRMNLSLCPGLEGAGTVVATGAGAEQLIDRTVAMLGGGMFAQYRKISVADCLLPSEGTSPDQAAAGLVNPLTVLAMVETFRREGHRALVHTAAASSLGHMLNRVCFQDGIDLVNIVRRPEHVRMLRASGASYVCDSSAPDFIEQLTGMIRATGATLAFDAVGGGGLASTILEAMEQVYAPEIFSIYGSTVLKQIYVYGRLNPGPLELRGAAGMAWSASGWLLMNTLARFDGQTVRRMHNRIVRELDTTFRTSFDAIVGFHDLLDPATLERISRRDTGGKLLLKPW